MVYQFYNNHSFIAMLVKKKTLIQFYLLVEKLYIIKLNLMKYDACYLSCFYFKKLEK